MNSAARRVAFVTPTYFASESVVGGGERYPLNVAQGIVKASGGRASVRIISFGPARDDVKLAEGVTMTVLPAAYVPGHALNPVSWDLVDVLQDVDVIHSYQVFSRSGEAAILLASILRKPVFGSDMGAHASAVGKQHGMLDLTSGVICISDFSARMMDTAAPVTVIRGGIDTERFSPPSRPPARQHVLYVGRLLPHKGIDNLVDAVPADLALVICGSPYDDAYHKHLVSLAGGKTVEFVTGATDDQLLELYRNAIATVLPSVYRDYAGSYQPAPELMGLALLESMACGTPAVCSRVGGMPELIREEETGFVFDTVNGLRDILLGLRDGRHSADEVGANARRAAVAEYDIGVVGAKVLDLYEGALAER